MRRFLAGLSLLGAFFITLQWVLKHHGKSLCQTEGCQLAMGLAHNESLILFIGMITFLTLGILFLSPHKRTFYGIDLILTGVLSVEGYLLGIQLFFLSHLCDFCIIIAILFFVISLLYSITYHRFTPIVGIFCLFIITLATYLISPKTDLKEMAISHYIKGKPQKCWYLFVKNDCPHCKHILNYCLNQQKDLELYICDADKCSFFLKSLGIKEVPALLIDSKQKKEILIGERCILQGMKKESEGLPQLFLLPPKDTCGIEICQ